ncbi:HAD family hydrolase [Bdellovibrionota bacterium FG-1]
MNLKPRFLPDREAATQWGGKGAVIVRMIQKGFAVPPTAAIGVTQVQEWLESLPEYGSAIQAWRSDAALAHLALLEQAILSAPMPEYWGLSAHTMRQFLAGDTAEEKEPWPLIFRPSVSLKNSPPGCLGGCFESVVAREAGPETLWKAFLAVAASAFKPAAAQRLLALGVDLGGLRVAVLIQPFLIAGRAGVFFSRNPANPELVPFSKLLSKRAVQAEKFLGGPANIEWIWDGQQLWFVQANLDGLSGQMFKWRDAPVQTLLIDLDGTLLGCYDFLAHLEFIIRAVWRFRKYGGFWAALRILKAVREAVEFPTDGRHELTNAERGAKAFAAKTGLSLTEAGRVLRDEVADIFPMLERYFFPVPGAKAFVDWASTRYRLILATNPVWPMEQVNLRLGWAGIDSSKFVSITHSERMHACKPSLDYYRELLQQEGLKAEDCALVGDDTRKDLPAIHAGISVFILQAGRNQPSVQSEVVVARATFGSYAELTALLQKN